MPENLLLDLLGFTGEASSDKLGIGKREFRKQVLLKVESGLLKGISGFWGPYFNGYVRGVLEVFYINHHRHHKGILLLAAIQTLYFSLGLWVSKGLGYRAPGSRDLGCSAWGVRD